MGCKKGVSEVNSVEAIDGVDASVCVYVHCMFIAKAAGLSCGTIAAYVSQN